MMQKPNLGDFKKRKNNNPTVDNSQRPKNLTTPDAGRIPGRKKKWSFGFTFWKQIENFGLGDQDITWFESCFDRLRQLSSDDIDSILSNHVQRGTLRIHDINWQQKNIPLQKQDFDWVPEKYRIDLSVEFIQFQISTARGRVIGFFDEDQVFQILLLDPHHNMQPSRTNDYVVRPTCMLLNNDFEIQRKAYHELRQLIDASCSELTCKLKTHDGLASDPDKAFSVVYIDFPVYKRCVIAMNSVGSHKIEDILELGITEINKLNQ